jgi:hypothetical protein
MNAKRTIEVFSAGCPACEDTIALVNRVACPSCEVTRPRYAQPGRGEPGEALRHPLGACGGDQWATGGVLCRAGPG